MWTMDELLTMASAVWQKDRNRTAPAISWGSFVSSESLQPGTAGLKGLNNES